MGASPEGARVDVLHFKRFEMEGLKQRQENRIEGIGNESLFIFYSKSKKLMLILT